MSIFQKQKQALAALETAKKALEESQKKIDESLKEIKSAVFEELIKEAQSNTAVAEALRKALDNHKGKTRNKDEKAACDYLIESVKSKQPADF